MASVCISSCVDDARVPVRATYVNIYKWPESDFEFVRSMSSRAQRDAESAPRGPPGPRVVDSISCRQLYLRSYTFSREEDYKREDQKTLKCLGRRVVDKREIDKESRKRKRGGSRLRGAKAVSCAAVAAIFRRLLSCTVEVKVIN